MHLLRANSPRFANGRVVSGDSSPFSPANTPNLHLWLDLSDASTRTEAGGLLSQVNDKSTNGFIASQGVGGRQPATNTGTVNGLVAADFTPYKFLTTDCPLSSFATADYTLFIVLKSRKSQQGTVLSSGNADNFVIRDKTTLFEYRNRTDSVSPFAGEAAVGSSSTDAVLLTCKYKKNTGYTIALNGGAPSSQAGGANDVTFANLRIGAQFDSTFNAYDGKLCELFIEKSLATGELLAKSELYMKTKWGIAA